MELSDISILRRDAGLVVGGRNWYRNKKDSVPYTYAVRILTTEPGVFLHVKLPINDEMRVKFRELKERAMHSPHHMAEVTFDNFHMESHTEKIINGILQTTVYYASATNFHFVEDYDDGKINDTI